MVEEAGVKTYLHAWGTEPVMDGNKVVGVIFESKSGRQAVLGKVVIDSTGDGDLLPYTGADFESQIDPSLRIANLSFSYWIANVDLKKYQEYRNAHQKEMSEQMREIRKAGGHAGFLTSNLKNQESVVWVFPRYANSSQVDVEELTRVEFLGRKEMLVSHDYYKKNVPGFEKSFIVLTNPQLGTRGSRRVVGEYVLTEKDMNSNEPFEDTIAIFPDVDRGKESINIPRHLHAVSLHDTAQGGQSARCLPRVFFKRRCKQLFQLYTALYCPWRGGGNRRGTIDKQWC